MPSEATSTSSCAVGGHIEVYLCRLRPHRHPPEPSEAINNASSVASSAADPCVHNTVPGGILTTVALQAAELNFSTLVASSAAIASCVDACSGDAHPIGTGLPLSNVMSVASSAADSCQEIAEPGYALSSVALPAAELKLAVSVATSAADRFFPDQSSGNFDWHSYGDSDAEGDEFSSCISCPRCAVLERHVLQLEEEISDLKSALAKAMEVNVSRPIVDVTTEEVALANDHQSLADKSPGVVMLNLDSFVEHTMPQSLSHDDCCTIPPVARLPTWVEADVSLSENASLADSVVAAAASAQDSTELGNVVTLLPLDATQDSSAIDVEDFVLVHGLSQAQQLNNTMGIVEGYDEVSERYMVRFAPKVTPSKIRARNLMFPAVCPYCSAEVTGSQCYACCRGYLLSHESTRPNNSNCMNSSKSTSILSSQPLPGPGTRRGTLSSLHFNHAGSKVSSKHLYSSHDT